MLLFILIVHNELKIHKICDEKLIKMKSEDKKSDFAAYLHDLALLNQNMLKGEEMTKFIKRSLEFVK